MSETKTRGQILHDQITETPEAWEGLEYEDKQVWENDAFVATNWCAAGPWVEMTEGRMGGAPKNCEPPPGGHYLLEVYDPAGSAFFCAGWYDPIDIVWDSTVAYAPINT